MILKNNQHGIHEKKKRNPQISEKRDDDFENDYGDQKNFRKWLRILNIIQKD